MYWFLYCDLWHMTDFIIWPYRGTHRYVHMHTLYTYMCICVYCSLHMYCQRVTVSSTSHLSRLKNNTCLHELSIKFQLLQSQSSWIYIQWKYWNNKMFSLVINAGNKGSDIAEKLHNAADCVHCFCIDRYTFITRMDHQWKQLFLNIFMWFQF